MRATGLPLLGLAGSWLLPPGRALLVVEAFERCAHGLDPDGPARGSDQAATAVAVVERTLRLAARATAGRSRRAERLRRAAARRAERGRHVDRGRPLRLAAARCGPRVAALACVMTRPPSASAARPTSSAAATVRASSTRSSRSTATGAGERGRAAAGARVGRPRRPARAAPLRRRRLQRDALLDTIVRLDARCGPARAVAHMPAAALRRGRPLPPATRDRRRHDAGGTASARLASTRAAKRVRASAACRRRPPTRPRRAGRHRVRHRRPRRRLGHSHRARSSRSTRDRPLRPAALPRPSPTSPPRPPGADPRRRRPRPGGTPRSAASQRAGPRASARPGLRRTSTPPTPARSRGAARHARASSTSRTAGNTVDVIDPRTYKVVEHFRSARCPSTSCRPGT